MTVGKAVCNCEQPDTCLCLVTVEADEKTYIYQQRGWLPNICVQDEDGDGVDVKINITPKGCVSGLSDCPSGILHHYEKKNVEYKLVHSKPQTCNLKYIEPLDGELKLSSKYNIVAIILMLIKDMYYGIDYTRYRLVVDECKDQEKRTTDYTYQNILLMLGIPSTVNFITVYPKYSIKLGVVIGTETAVAELSDNERREIVKENNQSLGHSDNHTGWTKKTGSMSITRALTIAGFSEYTIGKLTVKAETDQLKKEFIEYKNKLSFLNKAESVVSTVENLFTASAQGTSHRIFDSEILLPTAKIVGDVDLAINKTDSKPMMKGSVDLSLEPLIGVKFKVDLIQAFAAAYGLQYIVSATRDMAAYGKEAVKRGDNGAYVEGAFELWIEGAIDVGVSFFYDDDSKFDFKLLDNIEGKLALGGEISLEVGGKLLNISCYLSAGGSIEAEGCCGLERREAATPTESEGLDLVFYHNGVIAKFLADAGFGEKKQDKGSTTTVNDKGAITNQSNTSVQKNKDGSKLVEYIWEIEPPIKKEDSTYKVSIF